MGDVGRTIILAMYSRPKFLEILLEIRQEMARESDYDTDLFAETVRSGRRPADAERFSMAEPEQADERKRGKRQPSGK